jgi:hypothetical protein
MEQPDTDGNPGLKSEPVALELRVVDKLALTTVRIECTNSHDARSCGTGFFYDFVVGDKLVIVLVTNRHVIHGACGGKIRMHGAGTDNKINPQNGMWIEFGNFEASWIGHPDPEVDLCVMPIAPIIKSAALAGRNPTVARLGAASIPSTDELAVMSTIEDVLMIGCPNGIWDEKNGLPIMRRGCCATHPGKTFRDGREFLIDVCTIPGSSGSPVFAYRPIAEERPLDVRLLGIVHSVYTYTAAGEIEPEPISANPKTVYTQVPINLGVVIPARRLLDFSEEIGRRSRKVEP